jgi:hypothetical protein
VFVIGRDLAGLRKKAIEETVGRGELPFHPIGRDSAYRIDQVLSAKQFNMFWSCEFFHGAGELDDRLKGLISAGYSTPRNFHKLNILNLTRARG